MQNIPTFALAVSVLLGLTVSTPVHAEKLQAGELKSVFSGKTIHLSAPFGELPIRYSRSGTMVAKSMAMALFSGIYEDRGKWWVAGNRFCQQWKTWNNQKPQCFTVRRKGNKLHWVSNDGMSGTAREQQ